MRTKVFFIFFLSPPPILEKRTLNKNKKAQWQQQCGCLHVASILEDGQKPVLKGFLYSLALD